MIRDSSHVNAMIDYDRSGFRYENDRTNSFAVTIKNEKGFLTDIIETHGSGDRESRRRERLRRRQHEPLGIQLRLNFHVPGKRRVSSAEKRERITRRGENDDRGRPESLFAYRLSEHVPDLTSKSDILAVRSYLTKSFPISYRGCGAQQTMKIVITGGAVHRKPYRRILDRQRRRSPCYGQPEDPAKRRISRLLKAFTSPCLHNGQEAVFGTVKDAQLRFSPGRAGLRSRIHSEAGRVCGYQRKRPAQACSMPPGNQALKRSYSAVPPIYGDNPESPKSTS